MIDRLHIEKKYNSLVVDRIDETNFLGLGKQSSDRIDLFMFALAIGVRRHERIPLKNRIGIVLRASVEKNTEVMAEIRSLWIQEAIATNQEDHLDDDDEALSLAEEYANAGFKTLSEYLNNKTLPSIHTFISELDTRFKEIRKEQDS